MSLSDLASLGSFVSGVAVVATLVFLGLQMRQTNLNQRALMQQGRSARTADSMLRISEASEVFVRGMRETLPATSVNLADGWRALSSLELAPAG
jgi:hypothetical protein